MNIGLIIAGGTGQRMKMNVPKQFIKVFKNANGEEESMVQRVYRQIVEVDLIHTELIPDLT